MKKNQLTHEELKRDSIILEYLLKEPNVVYTKSELCAISGMSERSVRAELENIANFYPVRATAGRKGYSILRFDIWMGVEKLKELNNETYAQIQEIENRINSLKARLKPLIAFNNALAHRLLELDPPKEEEF